MSRARRMALATGIAFALLVASFAALVAPQLMRSAGEATGVADIGGPFQLVDDNGQPVTEATLAGKPYAMFFGFTFCPEVCPTTLADLARSIRALEEDADRLNYVFVTVDPERDTPEVMHSYVSAFDARIRGYTGTPEQIAAIAAAYRAVYERVPLDNGDYTMNHTAVVYLMDADGRFAGTIDYHEDPETALAKLRRLADGATNI